MLCTLDGKVVKLLAVVCDGASGEIDKIYLEEVREQVPLRTGVWRTQRPVRHRHNHSLAGEN